MFQQRKTRAKRSAGAMFRSTNQQRKVHHIHMAVSDIKWSDRIYEIKEIINNYRLPLLVKVTQGHFSGPDEDSLGQGQVVRLAEWQRVKRVKVRDVRGRIVTMPLSFGIPFGVVPYNMGTIRGRLTKLRQLKLADLVRRYQLPQRVKISSKHFSKRDLIIPGVDLISDTIDLVELYEEVVLQGNAINFGNLDETVLNIPLRNTEMEVIVGLGLKNGSQTDWDKLHASLTDKFNRKVRLPKLVDGKGVLIVHQVPSHNPTSRQPISPSTDLGTGTRKEALYKKRNVATPSVGSTLPNRYRTNEKKQRRLIKVDDDAISMGSSDGSSGLVSPDRDISPDSPDSSQFLPGGSTFQVQVDRRDIYQSTSLPGRGEHHPRRRPDDLESNADSQVDGYPGTHKTTENPLVRHHSHDPAIPERDYPSAHTSPAPTYDRRHFEESSSDSGHATWYTSGESVVGDLMGDINTTLAENYEDTERPQMIQDYLHSVEQDTIVRNKRTTHKNKDLFYRSKMVDSVGSQDRAKLKHRSRSVQEFNVSDTPLEETEQARSMYDLDDNSSTLSRPKDLFGTVAKINRFRPSLWSAGWTG